MLMKDGRNCSKSVLLISSNILDSHDLLKLLETSHKLPNMCSFIKDHL